MISSEGWRNSQHSVLGLSSPAGDSRVISSAGWRGIAKCWAPYQCVLQGIGLPQIYDSSGGYDSSRIASGYSPSRDPPPCAGRPAGEARAGNRCGKIIMQILQVVPLAALWNFPSTIIP